MLTGRVQWASTVNEKLEDQGNDALCNNLLIRLHLEIQLRSHFLVDFLQKTAGDCKPFAYRCPGYILYKH